MFGKMCKMKEKKYEEAQDLYLCVITFSISVFHCFLFLHRMLNKMHCTKIFVFISQMMG